jgi:hypothetical protein
MDTVVRAHTVMSRTFDRGEPFLGQIRRGILGDASIPCVCVFKRGVYIWEPLRTLSANNWHRTRSRIAESISHHLRQTSASEIRKHQDRFKKQQATLDDATMLVRELYNTLDHAGKKRFIAKHHKTFIGKYTCGNCLCYVEEKSKCLHADCGGLCKDCHSALGDVCGACGKTQVIECPICQDEKKGEEMVKSHNCCHSICWSCYGRAAHSGNSIEKCPLCRSVFSNPPKGHPDDDDHLFDAAAWHEDVIGGDDDSAMGDDDIDLPNLEILNHMLGGARDGDGGGDGGGGDGGGGGGDGDGDGGGGGVWTMQSHARAIIEGDQQHPTDPNFLTQRRALAQRLLSTVEIVPSTTIEYAAVRLEREYGDMTANGAVRAAILRSAGHGPVDTFESRVEDALREAARGSSDDTILRELSFMTIAVGESLYLWDGDGGRDDPERIVEALAEGAALDDEISAIGGGLAAPPASFSAAAAAAAAAADAADDADDADDGTSPTDDDIDISEAISDHLQHNIPVARLIRRSIQF